MAEKETIDGVDVEQLERIFWLLREKLPRVMAANRFFEEHTGYHNEFGANNLVDAFSHLATLVENAEQLGPAGQAEQVAHLEDHLRRSMMESFEQVLKYRLGEIADLWDEYVYFVRPLAEGRSTAGVTPLVDLEQRRKELGELLDQGRKSKRLTGWDDWERGTDALIRACGLAEALMHSLQTSLAAVEWYYNERRTTLMNYLSMGFGVAGVILGLLALLGII